MSEPVSMPLPALHPLWITTVGLCRCLRPRQWIKNGFVLAPLIFSGRLADPAQASRALAAALIFCALSGFIYLINDILDRERDRLHPRKCHRPLAAGQILPGEALLFALFLLAGGAWAALALGKGFALAAFAYLGLMLAYSFYLKHMVLLDVLCIAIGFALRVLAGVAAIDVSLSPWMMVTTLGLALFLGFHKRQHELSSPNGGGVAHRSILREYSKGFLEQMLTNAMTITIVAYCLWAFNHPVGPVMLISVPWVIYGLFRYSYLADRQDFGGHPEEAMTADAPLLVCLVGWLVTVMVMLYVYPIIGA